MLGGSRMNSVLEEILNTGTSRLPNGQIVPIDSAIPREEGAFLSELISEIKPRVSLEIGLAHGISTLFICDALQKHGGERHIVIDPHQVEGNEWGGSWGAVGLRNLEKAGFRDLVEFHPSSSHLALPELERNGTRLDFAFIDGWHTFDTTLMEFYYIDRMLRIGGAVVFDDADWPAVRKVCRYVVTNRAYRVWKCFAPNLQGEPPNSLWSWIGQHTPGVSQWMKQNSKPERLTPDESLGLNGRCIALCKEKEDHRRWDFHAVF